MGPFLQPLDQVLTSRSKVRLLRVLISKTEPLSGREAARLAKIGRVPAARSLDELVLLGVLHRQTTMSQHLYTLNQDSYLVKHGLAPLYRAERERVEAIFEHLRRLLHHPAAPVLGAWIFGSAARGDDSAESDLDLLVVVEDETSEHPVHAHLANRAEDLAKVFGLRLSPVVLTVGRLRSMDEVQHPLIRDVRSDGRRVIGPDLERLLR